MDVMTDTMTISIITIIFRTILHILAAEKNKCVAFEKKAYFLPLLLRFNCFCPRAAACSRPVVKYFPPEGLLTVTKKQTNPPTDRLNNRPISSQSSFSLSHCPNGSFNTKHIHAKVVEGQRLVKVAGVSGEGGCTPILLPPRHLPLFSIDLLLPLRMLRGKAQKHLLV